MSDVEIIHYDSEALHSFLKRIEMLESHSLIPGPKAENSLMGRVPRGNGALFPTKIDKAGSKEGKDLGLFSCPPDINVPKPISMVCAANSSVLRNWRNLPTISSY